LGDLATHGKTPLITGHENRRSLYDTRGEWHRVLSMNELRDLRRATGLGQREFTALLPVALETFRTWDSGRRGVPAPMLQRARAVVAHHARQAELLPLVQLANELHVHVRTLQAAVRQGRGLTWNPAAIELRFQPNTRRANQRASATESDGIPGAPPEREVRIMSFRWTLFYAVIGDRPMFRFGGRAATAEGAAHQGAVAFVATGRRITRPHAA